ncbi:T-cell differentiation antigen CD6-like [Pelodytes ibericus]
MCLTVKANLINSGLMIPELDLFYAPVLYLSGGGDSCAGRVEVLKDGILGSVCDDGWDALDAQVTCQQLGCGSALQALGSSHFGPGPSMIHLNELQCNGTERYLWDCPFQYKHQCTEREHAAVICTEHKAVRVSGGPGKCSGRVEVYTHGVWGTVCDNHWYDDEDGEMYCRALGCGAFLGKTSHNHTLSTFMAIICSNTGSLWNCKIYHKNQFICQQTWALGIICKGNITHPCPQETASQETETMIVTQATRVTTEDNESDPLFVIGICVTLAVLLPVSIIIISIITCQQWRQQRIVFNSPSLPVVNEYRESVMRHSKLPDWPSVAYNLDIRVDEALWNPPRRKRVQTDPGQKTR